jgi:hypothetical protein
MSKNQENEEVGNEKVPFSERTEKEFLLEILTHFVTLSNLIHEGKEVPAYKLTQGLSDKVKARIKIL